MLDIIELDFDYQDKPLLNQISFNVSDGTLLHLRGANGVGKTTLLKVIAGLYLPARGLIQFEGHSIHNDLCAYQQKLCYVGHKTGLNPHLTIKENCLFDIHYSHKKNIEELVSVFKLEAHIDQPCGLLSAGQKRQVALLRLWMSNARLWLLDEPLVALDDQALSVIMNKIEEHRGTGGAVILTSHQNLPRQTSYQEYYL